MRSRLLWIPAVLLIWACCPGQASAHLVNSGFGPFYDGVAHLFVTPEDILAVLAVALLAGLGGKSQGRIVLFFLPLAWLTGAVAGRVTRPVGGLPVVNASMLIALGALVAIGWNQALSRQFVAGCACLVGLVHGVLNGAALAEIHSGSLASVGIGMAVWILVALIAGQVAALKQPPARLVVRVAGSWIGAIGLLMLGWAVR